MHILIAPNAFKNSLTAGEAAAAIEQGLRQSRLRCTSQCFPIGDGGDGTAGLIIQKSGGVLVEKEVKDPLGRKIKTSFGLIDNGSTAVIEMADASGIRLLGHDERDPLHATSYGTGELIQSALDAGAGKIIIGMGGSATVDGGTGILSAMGMRFLNENGGELSGMPESLVGLYSIDSSGIDQRIFHCELTVMCDVDNRLLGEEGAATVFGPQKGASAEGVKKLEAALTRLNEVAVKQQGKDMSGIPYGGTAGGAAAGLHAFLDAKLVNGIHYFLELTGFEEALRNSDLVITGEGSIDEQTLQGKGPFGVAYRAKQRNIPVIGLAGKVPLEENEKLLEYFNVLMPIGNGPTGIISALKDTFNNLVRTSAAIGNILALMHT